MGVVKQERGERFGFYGNISYSTLKGSTIEKLPQSFFIMFTTSCEYGADVEVENRVSKYLHMLQMSVLVVVDLTYFRYEDKSSDLRIRKLFRFRCNRVHARQINGRSVSSN